VSSIICRLIIIAEFSLSALLLFRYSIHSTLRLLSIYFSISFLVSFIALFSQLDYPYSLLTAGYLKSLTKLDIVAYPVLVLICVALLKTKRYKQDNPIKPWMKLSKLILVVLAISAPLIYSAPDFILFETPEIHQAQQFENDSLFRSIAFSDGTTPQLDNNSFILMAVTPSCPFCQLLTTRIFFLKHYGYITVPIYYLVLSSDDQDVALFWKINHTLPFPYARVDNMKNLISIVGGSFPALYLMKGSNHNAKMDFRNFSLSTLKNF
jgi:hypothetical protein